MSPPYASRHPVTSRELPYFDSLFVGAAMLAGLFPLVLGPATGVSFIVLPALYCYFRVDRVWPLLGRVWPVLLLPAYALLSALWSPYPGTSAYYGIQFLLTVWLATMIGAGTDPEDALRGLFGAFLIHGTLTFLTGVMEHQLVLFGGGERPFVGIAGSKNATADMACLGVITASGMLGSAIVRGHLVSGTFALALIAMNALIIISAHSAGAFAAIAVAIVVLLSLALMRYLPRGGRAGLMVLAAVFAGLASATRSIWYKPLFEQFLAVSGKDDQLTGRGYLWGRAQVLIDQHPALGRGFASFWRPGELEAEAIWENMFIANRTGFNFHNSIYEILVYFGYAGLALFTVIFALFILLLLVREIMEPRPMTIVFCGLIAYDALRFTFESLPLGVFAHNTLFLYAALAHGVGLELAKSTRGQSRAQRYPAHAAPALAVRPNRRMR